jgi:hypothetical protein
VAPPLPPGSTRIAQWAAQNGLAYEGYPDEAWFRRWEPHDTITPPSFFLNGCTWFASPGHVVLCEPWYAPEEATPLDRTVMAFVSHPSFRQRASIRAGEHFLTRVAYLESPPPPEVKLGDPLWDDHVTTFARSREDAEGAFHARVRKLLIGWRFQGHLEMRSGGMVVFYAGLQPVAADYDRLLRIAREIVDKAVNPRR